MSIGINREASRASIRVTELISNTIKTMYMIAAIALYIGFFVILRF